jgi:hypothetical protein
MRAGRISTAAEIAVAGAGLLLLFLGLWSFADPQIFTDLYGIDVAKPSATIALRAMIGGGEIGLGLFLCLGGRFGVSLQARLLLAVSLFACVFLARAAAVVLAWPEVSTGMIRELAIEGALAVVFATLFCQTK